MNKLLLQTESPFHYNPILYKYIPAKSWIACGHLLQVFFQYIKNKQTKKQKPATLCFKIIWFQFLKDTEITSASCEDNT